MGQGNTVPKVTTQDRAILECIPPEDPPTTVGFQKLISKGHSMKLQRDKLKQYQKRIELVTKRETEIAKEALAAGNKQRALVALRRKKYQQSLLVKTDGHLETLQNLVSSIEFSLVEKDVLFGLQQGNSVLKEIHKEMNVESVEKLMSETADGIAYQKEIDEMLMSNMTNAEEDEVQAELATLQAEELRAAFPAAPSIALPQGVPRRSQPVPIPAACLETESCLASSAEPHAFDDEEQSPVALSTSSRTRREAIPA